MKNITASILEFNSFWQGVQMSLIRNGWSNSDIKEAEGDYQIVWIRNRTMKRNSKNKHRHGNM